KKAQSLAGRLEEEGYQVVIIGAPDHPEVRGIAGQTNNAKVIQNPEDVDEKLKYGKVGVLSQTTQTQENFRETVAKIVSYPKIIKIHNTICTATEKRQKAAKKLAKEVELMIVIGGKNSSNTKKLYELCSNFVEAKWIADESELQGEWFSDVNKVGITAGASTPKEVIDKVKESIECINS
ncbi:MAG: 4-hydroxy-3-methylbut-2-enyl diphosphate reductase, partial [Candidatus Nanoarchaeia archaeon]